MCIFSLSYQACKRGLSSFAIPFYVISETTRLSVKEVIECKMCVLISLQLLSDTFHIIIILQRDIIMYIGLHAEKPLFLSGCNDT